MRRRLTHSCVEYQPSQASTKRYRNTPKTKSETERSRAETSQPGSRSRRTPTTTPAQMARITRRTQRATTTNTRPPHRRSASTQPTARNLPRKSRPAAPSVGDAALPHVPGVNDSVKQPDGTGRRPRRRACRRSQRKMNESEPNQPAQNVLNNHLLAQPTRDEIGPDLGKIQKAKGLPANDLIRVLVQATKKRITPGRQSQHSLPRAH